MPFKPNTHYSYNKILNVKDRISSMNLGRKAPQTDMDVTRDVNDGKSPVGIRNPVIILSPLP